MKNWTKALPLLALLCSGSALAEPKDLQQIPEVDPPEVQEEQEQKKTVFQSYKPVTCTTDPYDEVKANFLESHGEVGLMRYFGDNDSGDKTGVEIIGNPDTGTITVLEFIPATSTTCFISMGKGLEINSLIFEQKGKVLKTKRLDI